MATHKDALKRHRQSEKSRVRNRTYRTKMRNQLKAFRASVDSGDKEEAATLFRSTVSTVQRLATKGIIHKRQAQRRVQRLAAALKKMG